jgi:SAM-dependent methyltransferase
VTGSADEGSGSAAEDRWVPYFDGTEGHEPRPLLVAALEAAGTPRPGGVAVELGCGGGVETVALLRAGWIVHAMDGSPDGVRRTVARAAGAGLADALTATAVGFEDFDVPAADLVYAGYSLPFCAPEHFPRVWRGVRDALRPGALLAVNLFGDHDTWAGDPTMNFHERDDAERLFAGLEVVRFEEEDADGSSFMGPKHWHVFDVLARKAV